MKSISILLFSFFCTLSLNAQTLKKMPTLQNDPSAFINYLLDQNSGNHAFKTTGNHERVIAQSTREYIIAPDSLTDSVQLYYSGSRNSTYDYNFMLYPYNYPYANTPIVNFFGYNAVPKVLYDTFLHWSLVPDLVSSKLLFTFYEETFGNYNANNKLIKYYDLYSDSVLNQNMGYINIFNPAGNIATGYWFTLTLGVPDSAYEQFYSYNASNLLTRDSIYIRDGSGWRMVAKSYYTYDVSQKLVQVDCFEDSSAPLREKLKYVNTYDGSGRLLTVLTDEFDGTALYQYEKDTFAYTSTLPFFTSQKMQRWDGVNHYWAPISYVTKHINTSLLPDTVLYQGFDSVSNKWVPQDKYIMDYDSLNNPVKLKDYVYNGASFPIVPSFITTYYYEQYIGVGIKNTIAKKDNAIVYPNPANENLFLSQFSIDKNTRIYISMTNINGQLLRTMSTEWQNNLVQIPISDLSPGVYTITIQNDAGEVLHQQAVIKR